MAAAAPLLPKSHGLVPGGNTIAKGRATWIAFASATCSIWLTGSLF
jgi:hypothetical protein